MRTALRNRRDGMWHSMGQGSGSVQDDHAGTDDDADQGEDQPRKKYNDDPEKARLIAENKRRRQQAREWRQRAEAAESKLSGSRDEGGGSGADGVNSAELVLAMVSAGMKPDRIKAAMKLVDFDSFDDPDDAIEELREQHEFLFSESDSADTARKFGRTAPAMNNARGKPGRETDADKLNRLAKRFPALGRRGL